MRSASILAIGQAGLLGLAAAGPVHAAPTPDQMVVFGDSLSDTGNDSIATQGQVPGPAYGERYNTGPDSEGRFTNGPVWAEHVGADLGLPTAPSLAGGSNFAFGGTQTGPPQDVPFPHLGQQVGSYLGRLQANPAATPGDDLMVLWSGANDFLRGKESDPSVPVSNITSQVTTLHDAGAEKFLVGNLPPLGLVPAVEGFRAETQLNLASVRFNYQLQQAMANLEHNLNDFDVEIMDVSTLFIHRYFEGRFNLPWAEFENVRDPIAPGLTPETPATGPVVEKAKRDQYMFWDEIHPSQRMHALIGELGTETVVDLYGDEADDDPLARGPSMADLERISTPEPGSAVALALGAGLLGLRRRRPTKTAR